MSAKKPIIWRAEPHTIAKIDMLQSYLYPWFTMLGRGFNRRNLWYIDGFAGPGEYTNYEHGSPLAALAAAAAAIDDAGAKWNAGDIHCVFMDDEPGRIDHLSGKLAKLPRHPRVHWHLFSGRFSEGLVWLKAKSKNPFNSGEPVFAFIDPFGPRGLSFAAVRDLLSRPACEVLINLDSDGISRIYRAGDDANYRTLLNDVFGDSRLGGRVGRCLTGRGGANGLGALQNEAARVTGRAVRLLIRDAEEEQRIRLPSGIRQSARPRVGEDEGGHEAD
jgi:three-Cys-motif partner protein